MSCWAPPLTSETDCCLPQIPRLDQRTSRHGRRPLAHSASSCGLVGVQVQCPQRACRKVPSSCPRCTVLLSPTASKTNNGLQTSSYVPVGRPTITQSRPAAPPTPVGTSYVSRAGELAAIRGTQEALFGRAQPAIAPAVVGTSYASKRDELAEIRRTQEELVGQRVVEVSPLRSHSQSVTDEFTW